MNLFISRFVLYPLVFSNWFISPSFKTHWTHLLHFQTRHLSSLPYHLTLLRPQRNSFSPSFCFSVSLRQSPFWPLLLICLGYCHLWATAIDQWIIIIECLLHCLVHCLLAQLSSAVAPLARCIWQCRFPLLISSSFCLGRPYSWWCSYQRYILQGIWWLVRNTRS